MAAVLRCLFPENLKQVGQKAIVSTKIMNFEKFSMNSNQKTCSEQFGNPPLSSEIKSITLQLTILTYFSKIDENLVKIVEYLVKNVNKNS